MASIEELLQNKGLEKPHVENRYDGREADQIRPVKMTRGFTRHAHGSCLIEMGETKVLCTASVDERVPPHMRNTGKGWITAEYSMLPASTAQRIPRESSRGKVKGRTHEIQRLIGRSLRACVDLKILGERTVWIDCDVLQADGGTRTASITGAYVALADAVNRLVAEHVIARSPLTDHVAAISVGIINQDELVLDLNYVEDSSAEVDMNVVMTGSGNLVEVQGTAEGEPFSRAQMNDLVDLAELGIIDLVSLQKEALERS